ncbi:MAG TPA: PAS domain S-box protein, partial [Allocoleopsis sp.]
MLELFLRSPQRILSAAAILDHAWTSVELPGEEAVRVHIKELRQKLKGVGAPKDFIKTVHRVGYQLNPRYSNFLADQIEQQPTAPQIAELAVINEELRQTLEELRVKEEELRQQNEQLEATQQTLELERQRYQDLFEFAPDAYLVTDIYGGIQEVNCAAARLFNVTPHRLISKPLATFISNADRHNFRTHLAQFNFQQNWEVNVKPREGAPIPVLISVTNIKNLQDEVVGLRWLLRDIRLRKEMEHQLRSAQEELEKRVLERTAKLRQREEFLSSIYNGAEQAVFVIDVTETGDLHYVDFNQRALQYSELTQQAVQGKTPEEAFGATIGAIFRQNYERCLQAGKSISYEEKILFEDRTIWTLTTLSPLRNAEGEIYRIVGTATDITDRKQVELALRESEAEFRAMFNVTGVGMAQADPQTRRFLRVNAAFCKITGYTEAELLTLTVDDINHPDDIRSDEERYINLLEKSTHYQTEKRYRRKDGSTVWVLATGNIIRDAEGQPFRAFALVSDITDRKQLEFALQTSEAKLNQIFNNASASIVSLRILADRTLQYDYCSAGCETIFGYTAAEMKNGIWWSRIPLE